MSPGRITWLTAAERGCDREPERERKESMSFAHKTVMITGASSGMGLLTSRCFVEAGANVVMIASSADRLQEKVREVDESGDGRAVGFAADVRSYRQISEACAFAKKEFGSLDITIGFAGGSEYRIQNVPSGTEFFDVPIEVYDWGIDVNLKGQFYLAHAAMKYMAEQKSGVIINIGSVCGEEGETNCVAYSAAKSGVMGGLTKSLALVGAPYGIRCCCVSPGPVLTRPGMASMKTLVGRAAEPQELVDMILYLCSEKAGFITGSNYFVDGGRVLVKDKL